VGFEFDLKGISSDPRDWIGAGIDRARDAMRNTEVTFDLPTVRTPDRVTLGATNSTVEFSSNNTMIFVVIAAAVYFFTRTSK